MRRPAAPVPARTGGAAALAVLGLALALALYRVSGGERLLDGVERAALDLRFVLRGPVAPAGEPGATIIAIDEAAVQRIGTGAPLRAALAGILGRIAAAGPAVIAIDLLLADPTAADRRLAAALAAAGPVLLAAAAAQEGPEATPATPEQAAALARSAVPVVVLRDGAPLPEPRTLILPRPPLVDAALIGHANLRQSPDRLARGLPVALRLAGGGWLPALPLAAARRAAGGPVLVLRPGESVAIGGETTATDAAGEVILNHYGPAGTIPRIALLDIEAGRADPALLAGRAVFIGATAESLRDVFATPFGADVPGVEVLASAYLNFREGRFLRRDGTTALATAGLALLLALGGILCMRLPGTVLPVLAGAGLLLLSLALAQAAFALGHAWLDATAMTGSALVGLALPGWLRYRRLARERDNLSYYVAPSLASVLAAGARPAIEGREQVVTVLFADLAGYTTLAERLPPAEVAAFLRRLHAHVERIATGANAATVGYMGDGTMIVFGLPDPGPGDARAALACAAALVAEPVETGTARIAPEEVRFRVSLHTGPVAIAVLGGERQGHITVTGDTVNVAARLQEAAKQHGVRLVASRAVLDAAGPEAEAGFRPLARDALRGRRRPVEIWTPRVPA